MSIEKSKWERCLKASPVVSVRNWCQASIPNAHEDRKSTRLNSSHDQISYAVFCLKKKINFENPRTQHSHSLFPILDLRSIVLHRNDSRSRHMRDTDFRRRGVS